jgi:hypothetical protein
VVSVLDEDQLFGTDALSEVDQVEESGLGEAFNCDISQPYKEFLSLLVVNARETPTGLASIQAYL